jgi:hypothetical protein
MPSYIIWKEISNEAFTTLMSMLQQLLQVLLSIPLNVTRPVV